MELLDNFLLTIFSVIRNFTISDVIDIVFISYIVYKAFNIIKETRAEQLLKGIALLLIAYFAATLLNLSATGYLLSNVLQVGILAVVILFQPELRRILEKVGRAKVTTVFGQDATEKSQSQWDKVIPVIIEATDELSKSRTGAIIIIERTTKLGEQIQTGVIVDAAPSVELFGNIFFNKSPLHDGAMIMRDGKIYAAACFLPKPQKEELIASNLGSRHRASIGISEISDAITIVVSEETGTVSIAEDGQLLRGFDPVRLKGYLKNKLVPSSEEKSKKTSFWKGKKK